MKKMVAMPFLFKAWYKMRLALALRVYWFINMPISVKNHYKRLLEENRRIFPLVKNNPLISVRIPTYNRGSLLVNRTIPSILNQSYQNFEVIIIGDFCDDDTESLINELNSDKIQYYNSTAENYKIDNQIKKWCSAGFEPVTQAIDICRGDWIATMDDDDVWEEDHLESLLNFALKNDLEMVYSSVMTEVDDNQFKEIGKPGFMKYNISHAAVMYCRRINFIRYNGNLYKYKIPRDFELWERMKKLGVKIGHLDKVTAKHYL